MAGYLTRAFNAYAPHLTGRPSSTASRCATLARHVLLALTLVALTAGAVPAKNAAAGECAANAADCFLQTIGDQAVELLGDSQISAADREQRFHTMLDRDFSVPRISRFIIGRYWRQASEQERRDFMTIFGKVMARRFVPLFSGLSRDQFSVGPSRQDGNDPETYFVETTITATERDPVKATWRVDTKEGRFKILDVVVEGVSYAMTLRSEYASVLKRDQGDVGKLVGLLRRKVN